MFNLLDVLLEDSYNCCGKDVDASNKENIAPGAGPKYRRKVKQCEAREYVEAYRQVPLMTRNMYEASSVTNTGKHKHDSDSEVSRSPHCNSMVYMTIPVARNQPRESRPGMSNHITQH